MTVYAIALINIATARHDLHDEPGRDRSCAIFHSPFPRYRFLRLTRAVRSARSTGDKKPAQIMPHDESKNRPMASGFSDYR
jgi:hypothetical protein